MAKERITLSGADAEHFREIKEEIAEGRRGYEPSNAEAVRRLMEQFNVGGRRR